MSSYCPSRFTLNRITLKLLLIGIICVSGCASLPAPVGWRTDGTGANSSVRPPVEWSNEANILWATPMASWSNSSPIIVGDRLFVCSEPTSLVCLRLTDGKILWQKDNSTLELLPSAEADDLRAQLEKAEPLTKDRRELKNQIGRVQRKVKKDPDNESLAKDLQGLRDRLGELKAQLAPLEEHILTGKSHSACGFSSATPVSDGQRVYVMFGNSVVACYDLHGDRQWIRRIDRWIGQHSTSPLLAGDKLLVQAEHLVALNKVTGEEIWRTEAKRRSGTPVRVRVGDVDAIATANGDIIRIEDGYQIAEGLGSLQYNSPILHNGVLYYSQSDTRAWKLPSDIAAFTSDPLWRAQLKKDRYYASPVYHKGLIYSMTKHNVLSVIDAGNGEIIYEKQLDLGKGDAFPSTSIAGGYLFVSNSNGTTLVLKPGREYEAVAKSELEEFRSSLVFVGDKIYLRGLNHMYCIANQRSATKVGRDGNGARRVAGAKARSDMPQLSKLK